MAFLSHSRSLLSFLTVILVLFPSITESGKPHPPAGKPGSGPPPTGKPGSGSLSTGKPESGPLHNGKPQSGPLPNGKPQSGPLPTGKPESGLLPTGKPESGTLPTGKPDSNPLLTENYYEKTCPKFHDIVHQIVTDKQLQTPTTAAAVLRIFFHDCVLEGCDASLLIASNAFNKAERDSDSNKNLPGDGFDVITRIKTNLELQCPGVVSCSDILATATRNLVSMTGGPHYPVKLGRKDGLISSANRVEGHYANVNMTMDQIIKLFADINLNVQELVVLSGAHTIGFSHCEEFSSRIFNFSKTADIDPTLNPKFAEGLRKLCANYTQNPAMSAFNDPMTPGKFDNIYFQNLQRGLGLLTTDQMLISDQRTKPFVELYSANQTKFFEDFGVAMQKVGLYKVKTGNEGEVRRRCDAFNNLKT